jgi:hypothetical protein
MSKAPKGKVRCDSCRRLHRAIFEEHEQGDGCAATYDATKGLIYGHYGSRTIDTEVHRVKRQPKWLRPGTICDTCVTRLQKENLLEECGRCL